MIDINSYSFKIKYQSVIGSIKKDNDYKLAKVNNRLIATNFNNEIQFEILPLNIDDKIQDLLKNIPTNYFLILDLNKQQNVAIIEVHPVFDIRQIQNLYIFAKNKLNPDVKLLNTDNAIGIVLLHNIYEAKNKSFLLESTDNGRYYQINQLEDFDKESKELRSFYKIDNAKTKGIKRLEQYQKVVIYGDIKISDKKSYLSADDKFELYKIKADVQSYINLWNSYNEIELKKSFETFKNLGHIKYDYITYGDKIRLYFNEENFKKINPSVLSDNMIMVGGHEFLDLFKCENLEAYNKLEKELLKKKAVTICSVKKDGISNNERYITISTNDRKWFQDNSNMGYIGLSLLGNKIAYERRNKAKEKIINGKAGIAKLYTYFTDNPEPADRIPPYQIDHRLIKHKNLTLNQLEAISIICNTPDIAIIQGPPGTGKTTTILEALTQLNSGAESKYSFGNNLLSGFRHDTVLNMTENIDLFGLPAIKIGDKNSDNDEIEPKIEQFINQLIDKLLEKYKDLTAEDSEYIDFKKKYFSYKNFSNSIDSSIEILKKVKELDRFKHDINVEDKIDEFISKLKRKTSSKSSIETEFVNFLYSIPLTLDGINDDLKRIREELEVYEEYNEIKQDVKQYKKAFEGQINIGIVKDGRMKLILKYRKEPAILASNQEKSAIVEYLDSLLDILNQERYKKFNGDKIAILEYIDSLTENPKLIKDTLLDYTKVLGATNQQALSKNMADVKQDELLFDNVIIDEAATSSPLDLFIPMSLGKKRIVLVGDHRQLPNITDDDIINDVYKEVNAVSEDKLANIAKDMMKTTLFEILMDKARILEKKDGIKRVITLNSQFRMHPELGNIVSNYFYKNDGGISSPRPASDFAHNYHGLTNKYLYWLDVPFGKSKKEYRNKNSTSRRNPYEAMKIAHHIKEALDSNGYQRQSIGVITIYKDQVKEINAALKKVGILNEKGQLEALYSEQKLLVGTVDAFQGREFDIVYLSLAYTTNDIRSEKYPYSRLAWDNSNSLLCVALSRQKKMLIVVGDMKIYKDPLCRSKIPCIYDLANRCSGGDMHE